MPVGGEQRSGYGRDPNLVGLLSLQLLLLAFFILLVNMSTFDVQRVRSVLGSVQAAFSEASTAPDSQDQLQRADSIILSEIVEEIEGVLASTLQLDRVARDGDGAITFELPADALFAAGTAQLAPGRDDILRRLVAALDRRPAGYRYEVEMLVGRTMPGGEGAAPALEIARAGALARTLHGQGAVESGLAAGLLPAAPGRLRIAILLTEQPRPRGLFAVVPGGAPGVDAQLPDRDGGR